MYPRIFRSMAATFAALTSVMAGPLYSGTASRTLPWTHPVLVMVEGAPQTAPVTVRLQMGESQPLGSERESVLAMYDLTGRLIATLTGEDGIFALTLPAERLTTPIGPFWLRPYRPGEASGFVAASGRLFEDISDQALPMDSSWAVDAEIGDVDGDGDLDLVVCHQRGAVATSPQLLINDGQGVFRDETVQRLPALQMSPSGASLADVDNDGDLDLLIRNSGSGIGDGHRLLINDGQGRFDDETDTRLAGRATIGPCRLGDLDGDGDVDLIGVPRTLEMDSLTVLVYANDGQGGFPDDPMHSVRVESRCVTDIALADVDGDGDLDAVFGCLPLTVIRITADDTDVVHFSGQNLLLINDGTGYFSDDTSSRLPGSVEDNTARVLAGDVDSDGDVDLLFVNRGFEFSEANNRLLINKGDGTFVDATLERLSSEPVVGAGHWNNGGVLADFTGDGAPDVFLATVDPGAGGPARDILYVNDGTGRFVDRSATDLPAVIDFSVDAAAGDVDGDGDLDLFVANSTPSIPDTMKAVNRLYANTGVLSSVPTTSAKITPGAFRLLPAYPNPFNSSTVVRFEIQTAARVRVSIQNVTGRTVRTLHEGVKPAGQHMARWDGRDDSGKIVPSGIYLIRLSVDERTAVRKVLFLR